MAYEVVVKRVASSMVCKLEVFAGISGRGTVKHQVWKDLHNVGSIQLDGNKLVLNINYSSIVWEFNQDGGITVV